MKKNISSGFVVTLIIAITAVFTSCKKDFLDEPKPSSSVSSTDVYASDAGVRSFFSGLYRVMRVQYGSSTDAWGIASVNLSREARGLDLALNGNWYNFDYLHDNREPTYRRTSFTWTYFYDFINQANNLIDGVEKSSLSEASKTAFSAEARAMRAWCYFELVREFSQAYVKDPNSPGVPLYTTPTTAQTSGNARAKLSEVYDLIISDLTFAAANLGTARQLKDVINKNVANGLLARVCLEKGDYANAKTAAVAARTGYNLTVTDYNTPFTSVDKTEVIWGFPQASDQTIYYGTPSAFWGASGTGYFNFFIDSNFVNTFRSTDVRAKTFTRTTAADFRKYRSNKFGTTTNFSDHIIMMRASEMYLIEAEAKARLGEADAGTFLYTLQKNRDGSATASENTGQNLLNEILLERRKELYGEIGVSFLDIKRLNLPLIRSNGHPVSGRLNIPAGSNIFTLKIPQSEFDANKSLAASDQNP